MEHVVGRLVARQFPPFSDRRVTAVESGATDNAVYRLGEDLLVRVPRNAEAATRLERELRWLPEIARQVSVRVPVVVGVGHPDVDVAYPWAVQRWIEGHDATSDAPGDWPAVATSLGRAWSVTSGR